MPQGVILVRYRVPNGIDGWVVVHDEDEGICNRLQFVLWGGTDSQIALLWCECLISNEFMLNGLTFDEHGKFGYDFMKTNWRFRAARMRYPAMPRREKAKCKGKVNKEVQDSVMDVKQLYMYSVET